MELLDWQLKLRRSGSADSIVGMLTTPSTWTPTTAVNVTVLRLPRTQRRLAAVTLAMKSVTHTLVYLGPSVEERM